MSVDFSIQTMIEALGQVMFDGNTTLAGLFIMVGIFLLLMVVMASLKAPVVYSLVPMIPLSIMFTAMNIMDSTVGFLIIILSAVVIAMEARKVITGKG